MMKFRLFQNEFREKTNQKNTEIFTSALRVIIIKIGSRKTGMRTPFRMKRQSSSVKFITGSLFLF